MAAGDILSGTILADGWHLDLVIEGLGTGGTYSMGWTAAQDPELLATPKCKLVVTSLGYKGKVATTVTRNVYASLPQRKAYPNEAQNEESFSTNTTVRLRLNKKIYAKDKSGGGNSGTDVMCTILSGLYTQGGTPSAARSSFALTNNSTVAYPKPVANWSIVGAQLMQGSSFTLKCTAFSKHYKNNEPVDCVEFTLAEGANTVTNTQYESKIDSSAGDPVPVVEYIATMSLTTLTQSAVCTANFKVYPFIGDSGSILDSSAGTAWPTALYGPLTFVCDKGSTYGQSVAVVDTGTGNDGTGVAADISNLATANASPFLTLAKAAVAITTRNTATHSRGDCGAGIVYLKAGNHTWLGAANTGIGTTPNTWITFMPYPGVTRAQAVISAFGTTGTLSGRVKIENVTVTVATANTFTNIAAFWAHNIDLNTTGTIWNTTNGWQWMTLGKVTASSGQGLRQNSSTGSSFAMIRGVDLPSFSRTMNGYNVIGCNKYGRITPNSILISTSLASTNNPVPDTNGNWIIAFNKFTGLETPTVMFECGVNIPCTSGAFVQNLFETCGTQANGLADFGASDGATTNTPHTNIIVAHNTMTGNRCFDGYNDAGTLIKEKLDWSRCGNYFDRWASKTDTHPTQNANRIGNWEVMSGVDTQGDYRCQNMISGSSFYAEFDGTSSYNPAAGNTGTAAEAGFVDRKSATEIATVLTAGAGDGNYNITPSSPLCNRLKDSMIKYDLEGKQRCVKDASGAYALRKASFRANMLMCC